MPPATNKRGLCWPTENHGKDEVHTFTKPGSKISWLYNWSPSATPNANSLDWVPMQWNHVNIDDLQNKVKAANATTILGFNEPELPDQSNVDVELAAKEWLRCIEPMRKAGIRCGSPGISSAPQGVQWLKEFLKKIKEGGSDVDFYTKRRKCGSLNSLVSIEWTRESSGQTLTLAATNWDTNNPLPKEHVEAFAKDSVAYLDGIEWIERYAWFGAMRDAGTVGKWARMLDNDGKLTDLGKAYRDV
ncbi:hypothetical protein LTS10_007815 [Elasticomyces elasticus]|nr:hypothetical protein LTS10_007815 [Elasticomyces elasticus]